MDKESKELISELINVCKKAYKFIEYARYVLDEGLATIGSQFPKQKDADIEMKRLDDVIVKAYNFLEEVQNG